MRWGKKDRSEPQVVKVTPSGLSYEKYECDRCVGAWYAGERWFNNPFPGIDEQIIAIQMPSPVTDSGVPVETVLSALRDVLSEDEITELIDIICAVQDSPELTTQQ